jgi:hypothetical protein
VAVPDVSNSGNEVVHLKQRSELDKIVVKRDDEISHEQTESHRKRQEQKQPKKKKKKPTKKKPKAKAKAGPAVVVPSFIKCKEAYNGIFDVGICRGLGLKPPSLVGALALIEHASRL